MLARLHLFPRSRRLQVIADRNALTRQRKEAREGSLGWEGSGDRASSSP